MESNSKVEIAVCIATYHRPLGLERLLDSLKEQRFKKCLPPVWRVVVVDNDPAMSGRVLVEKYQADFSVPLLYDCEPRKGIAPARNCSVRLAGAADLIAFIDDDETAEPDWLDHLLFCRQSSGSDIIAGPVIPCFEEPPPAWAVKGRFFDRKRHVTGASISYAATNNVLVDAKWLREEPGPFDIRPVLDGGDDTLLFARLVKQGARITWMDEAVVNEFVKPERVSLRWLAKRAFRVGNTLALVDREVFRSCSRTGLRVLKAGWHIVFGIGSFIPRFLKNGYAGLIKSALWVSRGMGEFSMLLGLTEKYFKRPIKPDQII